MTKQDKVEVEKKAKKTPLGKRLKEFVDDVATLDVVTLSGDISATPDSLDIVEDTNIAKAIKKSLRETKGTVKLVALSQYEFDGDCTCYIASDIPDKLFEHHKEIAKSAMQARMALIKLIGDSFSGLVKPWPAP